MSFKPLVIVDGLVQQTASALGDWLTSSPSADNQIFQSTGADAGAWTTDVEGLTSLVVDSLTLDGSTISDSGGTITFGSHLSLAADDRKSFFGAAGDASIYYDGTDLIVNPREVGAGDLNIASDIVLTPVNSMIRANTADGSDDHRIILAGGGAASTTRGAYISVYGADHASVPGGFALVSGIGADILLVNGTVKLNADNQKLMLGAGADASIYYDGTDLIIDPQEVGSGKLDVLGTLQADGYNSADGTAGTTADVAVAKVGGGTRTLHFKNGLYTGYTDS